MKKIINKELVKKIIEDYNTLGFSFLEDQINNTDVCYADIKLQYTYNDEIVVKYLKEIDAEDINKVYFYQNSISETERERIEKKVAFISLIDYIKDKTVKSKIDKKMIDYLTEEAIIKQDNDKKEKKVKDNDSNNNKIEKVVNVEENKKVANSARTKINKDSILVTAGIIILSSAIGFAAYNYIKSNKKDNDKEITIEDSAETSIEIPAMTEISISNDSTDENIDTINEEETTEELNVHSDEFINNVTDKIINNIQLDENLSYKYNRDLVEALVRYTHHNYDEYTGDNILSNESAYEDLSELINHGFDISMFYEGLNNYDNLNALFNSTKDLKQEKGQYEDEFKIYMCMDVVMNDMNTNNFAEAVALRAYVDNFSMIPSMQMAREQAGVLEMKDTSDLWKDVNKDGKATYEENAEGKGYDEEKASAMAAKYGEMSSEVCKDIYKRISTDDRNSELSVIVYKALDEDDARVKTR